VNINVLINLHLDNYLLFNGYGREMFPHLTRQLLEDQDLQDRRNFDGHVTSSFALLNPEQTHLLMIHHIGFDKWLFPGGHYEGDVAPRTSALRELNEETGFPTDLVEYLHYSHHIALDIDSHAIPPRPHKNEDAHWHHDFLYLGLARDLVELTPQVDEVSAAKWISLDEAVILPDERIKRSVSKIMRIVGR
jgi:8-oxo-dGTP pyrophosphatase MutT (NUDIX family)